jgi:DNA-binding IscR family transcriptional regulator
MLKKRYDTRKRSGDEVKYSTKYSDAIHILAYIHLFKGTDLSSDRIAQSVETNPAYVRRIMSDLRVAGLIESQRGKPNPKLTKEPNEISLLDIYASVEKDHHLLHADKKTNPKKNNHKKNT